MIRECYVFEGLVSNAIPHKKRRYAALANFVSDDITAQERIQDIEEYHPVMETRIPVDAQIANAFGWRGNRVSMDEKYGRDGVKVARALCQEVKTILTSR